MKSLDPFKEEMRFMCNFLHRHSCVILRRANLSEDLPRKISVGCVDHLCNRDIPSDFRCIARMGCLRNLGDMEGEIRLAMRRIALAVRVVFCSLGMSEKLLIEPPAICVGPHGLR
jgi:hypothetical protein